MILKYSEIIFIYMYSGFTSSTVLSFQEEKDNLNSRLQHVEQYNIELHQALLHIRKQNSILKKQLETATGNVRTDFADSEPDHKVLHQTQVRYQVKACISVLI